MHTLGLTGGIGSGKSTVAGFLARRGAQVIDADAISRRVTATGGAAITPIAATFGPAAIGEDGALDRDWMRQRVFSDSTARTQLEQIVHPLVGQEIGRQTALARDAGVGCLVFDIPLLVESGHWRKRLDRVLVVDCTRACQVARVQARNALAPDAIHQIIDAQASRALRLAAADVVVFNDGLDLDGLGRLVDAIAAQFGL